MASPWPPQGAVVTFGIVPSKPETGYGYIRQGEPAISTAGPGGVAPMACRAFVEKPDAETAQGYLASGDYLWNSGIFVLKASLWLGLIERFRPDIAQAAGRAFAEGEATAPFCGSTPIVFARLSQRFHRLCGHGAPVRARRPPRRLRPW